MSERGTRFPDSVNPVRSDGRDIDPALGALLGEGAQQRSHGEGDPHLADAAPVWRPRPDEAPGDVTYYERPLLQQPVWEWAVPAYYYVGGLTGASLVLSAAAQWSGAPAYEKLIRRCHWLGVAGCSISGGLLVWDLGRPERFLNMLRVFRPTSPMNVGAWILTATSGSSFAALFLGAFGARFRALARLFGYLAGFGGAGLATYTGVLVGNTVVPVWQASRRALPILFGASAMASTGAFLRLLPGNSEERRLGNLFGAAGQAVELLAAVSMERQASQVPRVGRPFREGLSGALWRTAAVLSAGGLLLALLPGKSKQQRIAAGVLGTLGSALMRMSIEKLGTASALDARASFHQQRAKR